ncbi:MAG: TauD/TfdA family dioxygenase [Coxiellaceae bacterium]|nr:TauD/TfdA family dioxygenase [Coxiellaceae bacterium]
MQEYIGVKTRFLCDNERLIKTNEKQLPFVIEPASAEFSSVDFLQTFLSKHSADILSEIAGYGAILLRGFSIHSTKEFEKTVLAIQGMKGMSHLFMSEPGRERVDGLEYIFHTNSKIKTGGALHLGGFHTENYYSPDVPNYIAFCCFHAAKLGGETGLINMASVYEKLDISLKKQLEKKSFFVSKWPLGVVANRYQVNPELVKKACNDFGLSLDEKNFVHMYKPSVLKHPITNKKIIQANLCAELPAVNDEILNYFMPDYKGLKWIVHKAAWKLIGYHRLRKLSLMLPALARHPIKFLKMRKKMQQRMKQYTNNSAPRINSVFKKEDIKTLASSMYESYASFLWHKGDILLVDNLQVAHAGMPGKTTKKFPRKIRAMLCNPLKLSYSDATSGLQDANVLLHETLGEVMHKLGGNKVERSGHPL